MNQRDQTLIEHLMDLKKCVWRSVVIILVGFFACVYFSEQIFNFIRAPVMPYLGPQGGLVFTAPIDKFMAHIKVSLLAGIILTCPFWLYQVWQFIAPGLYKHEKNYARGFIFFGTILFLTGAAFVYILVFPMAFKYLFSFGGEIDKPMITITEYLGFFMTTTLMFGLAFEMPLILVILGMIGIVSSKFLAEKRRIAIFLIALLSALVTPPDALSMVSLMVPLFVLYEISIVLVRFFEKKKQQDSLATKL